MFVCLGWGSLIWCQKALPVRGSWQADGPQLPLEFARKSSDGRLTLVVTDQGTLSEAFWAEIDVQTLAAAREALAEREGVPQKHRDNYIGHWSADGSSSHAHNQAIGKWAAPRAFAAVVWTALPPKSPVTEQNGDFPSETEVLAYLAGLKGAQRDRAEEYIRLAPRPIVTGYRAAIEDALGWQPSGLV